MPARLITLVFICLLLAASAVPTMALSSPPEKMGSPEVISFNESMTKFVPIKEANKFKMLDHLIFTAAIVETIYKDFYQGECIPVQGRIKNLSRKEEKIILTGEHSEFRAKLEESLEVKKIVRKNPPGFQHTPQMPPRPVELILPPNSIMVFEKNILLCEYDYKNQPKAKLIWSFNYWAKSIIGEIEVVLPKKKPAQKAKIS